ncbi:MAG: hypothetical protein RR198_00700 [Oscillospiraceae bacterium]
MWKKIVLDDLLRYAQLIKIQPVLKIRLVALGNKIRRSANNRFQRAEMPEQLDSFKKLSRTINANQGEIEDMERALEFLPQRESEILHHFYVDRQYGYLDIISEELGIERSQIYRLKDRALKRLSLYIYGMSD